MRDVADELVLAALFDGEVVLLLGGGLHEALEVAGQQICLVHAAVGLERDGAPLRNAAIFFARSLSGSDRKWPISRLMQKMTTLIGIRTSRTAMEASYTSMHTTAVTTAASRLSSVAKSAKYVCSRFIA